MCIRNLFAEHTLPHRWVSLDGCHSLAILCQFFTQQSHMVQNLKRLLSSLKYESQLQLSIPESRLNYLSIGIDYSRYLKCNPVDMLISAEFQHDS
jgi:hypothetical protein